MDIGILVIILFGVALLIYVAVGRRHRWKNQSGPAVGEKKIPCPTCKRSKEQCICPPEKCGDCGCT